MNASGVPFQLGRNNAMENHKKIIQHSKSAVHNVHSKVSKISGSINARAGKRKTCSHGEVSQKPLKKRGVYVEKKAGTCASRPDIHVSPLIQAYMAHTDRGQYHHRRSPQPKQRNTFISNVLSVLSKSTASTQHPPIDDTAAKGQLLSMALKRNASVDTKNAAHDTKTQTKELVDKIAHRHKKHSHRVGHKRRSPRPLIVLKSKNNILQTPSNVSQVQPSQTNVRKSRRKKAESVKKELQRSIYSEHESKIANAVLEGQEYRTTRRKLIDDQPVALVSTIDQPEDKNLYKLFMDLMETTFSVYNVDTTARNPPLGYQRSLDHQDRPQSYMVTDNQASYYPHYASYPPRPRKKTPAKPCLKSNIVRDFSSEHYVRSIRRHMAEPRALPAEAKRAKKEKKVPKHRKDTLLWLLRHELDMETNMAGPPNNLYHALRAMARNKTRRHLTRFGNSRRFDSSPSPSPDRCTLRRQTVLTTKKKPVFNKRTFQQLREQLESSIHVDDSDDEIIVPQIEDVSSYRTLEVLSYDRKGRVGGKKHDESNESVSWDSAHELT